MPTSSLRPHPRNAAIYGESVDEDFLASVRQRGILEPLTVAADGTIVSGHRRYAAALRLGLATVPVTIFASQDELDILESLVHCNKSRTKTPKEIGREAEVLMEVEKERAKRRQIAAQNNHAARAVPEPVPEQSEPGDARDKVGQQLGMSGPTVESAVKVVKALDALEAEGRQEEAQEVERILNERGFKPAAKAAERLTAPQPPTPAPPAKAERPGPETPPPATPPTPQVDLMATAEEFVRVRQEVSRLRDRLTRLAEMPGGEDLRGRLSSKRSRLTTEGLEELSSLLFGSQPQCATCPLCRSKENAKGNAKGNACALCDGRGWLPRRTVRELPAEAKKNMVLIRPQATDPD